ncbi:MAG TPA: hypothetical protein VIV40_42510, partial [Kofleriaceae bacterium]
MKRAVMLAALLAVASCATETEEPACVVDPTSAKLPCLPPGSTVYLGSRRVDVIEWTPDHIRIRIPADAAEGVTKLTVYLGDKAIGSVPFAVASKKDKDLHNPDAVALDPDEKQYVEAILNELKNVAQRDQVPELDEFAHKLEKLLEKAENGEITKQELLEELSKAEQALNKDAEPNQAEIDKQMGDMGKELAKQEMTKELGEALQKNDLKKAKEEFEKLAEKLDKKQLSEKQKEELGKQMEKVAKQMEKQEQEQQ